MTMWPFFTDVNNYDCIGYQRDTSPANRAAPAANRAAPAANRAAPAANRAAPAANRAAPAANRAAPAANRAAPATIRPQNMYVTVPIQQQAYPQSGMHPAAMPHASASEDKTNLVSE